MFSAALAAAAACRTQRSLATLCFSAGMLVFAVENLFGAIENVALAPEKAAFWETLALVAKSFLPGVWLTFSLTYSRANYRDFLMRSRWLVIAAFLIPLLSLAVFYTPFFYVVVYDAPMPGWGLRLSEPAKFLNVLLLVSTVLILMNIERTFRAAVGTMRWRIKFLVLGLGVIFGARIYTRSQALLFSDYNPSQLSVEATALLIGCALIAVAYVRTGFSEIDVYPSRAVLHTSVTVLLTGAYLFVVGVLAQVVARFGGTAGFPIAAFVVLLGVAIMAVLFLSERARQSLQLFISRHFKRPQHGEAVIEPMTRLLKKNPELRPAALVLAAAYGSLDRFDDAAVITGEQARLAPRDPQAQMALGLTLRQAKRNGEARQAFEKAAELAPESLWPMDQLIELDILEKHFDAARETIRHQFQKTPDSPAAHFFEGKILSAEQKWDLAEAELQKTLRLDSNFAGAYDLLVQTYLASNKLPQALSQLQTQLSKDPNDASALMMLALLYERTNHFAQARDAYERLLRVNPDSIAALNNLACIYADRLGDLGKAYDLARKAREQQANDPAIADTFGWVLFKRGEYQQALPILQESAAKLPDSPEVQFHLGMTAYMMGQTDSARVALQKAANAAKDFPGKEESKRRLALLKTGNGASPELSLSQLEAMVKEQPNDLISQMRLGEAYEKQGASDKAAAAFEQALKLNPGLTAAITKLAQLYAGPLQNKEKAFVYAKKARERTPGDPQATRILGKVAYQTGNFTWSYSLLQEAARQTENDPSLLHDLAWAAYSLGKLGEAREIMQKAVTASSNFPEAADARIFLSLTALDENPKALLAAENEIQKQLQADSQYLPALMAQAALDEQRGQIKPAAEIYSNILRRSPDFAAAQKRLATLYAQEPSTTSAAYDLATKARKTLPDDTQLSELLGRLSYEKKEYQRAIQLLQESARKSTLSANSLFYLGMSQLQTKQANEARDALNQALVGGLQEPLASEARHGALLLSLCYVKS